MKTYVGFDVSESPGCLEGSSSSSSSGASSSSGGPSQTYLEATNVDGDTILEQSETEYDDAGHALRRLQL